MSRTGTEARAWAKSHLGQSGWDNLCLSFVRQAFELDYVGDWSTASRNAGTAWDRAEHKHRTSNPNDIPEGVPVFFELRTAADHVVLSDGAGWCIGNDFVVDGRIDRARIADIAARWGPLLGWTEDLVGNRIWTPPAPEPKTKHFTDLTFQHTSLQFSDTDKQVASDAEKIFGRDRHICGGTEAGGRGQLLRAAAKRHGYRFHIGFSDWLAVSREVIDGGWDEGFVPILDAGEGGPHTERGIPWVSFDNADLGRITVGAGHWLTKGAKVGDPNFALNEQVARAVGRWGKEMGAGSDLVFYLADVNRVDRDMDVFSGHPFETGWDELGHYENTGHGNIDVVASFKNDVRVEAKMIRALDDTELALHIDHFLVEARYRVRHLK